VLKNTLINVEYLAGDQNAQNAPTLVFRTFQQQETQKVKFVFPQLSWPTKEVLVLVAVIAIQDHFVPIVQNVASSATILFLNVLYKINLPTSSKKTAALNQ
jgi:hypothetical protein